MTSLTSKIAKMLHWLQFRDMQASMPTLKKSLKSAWGVGARENSDVVSTINFLCKIAQMLHWLEFRDSQAAPIPDPFFDLVDRVVQIS